MVPYSLSFIAQVTQSKLHSHNPDELCSNIITDSRTHIYSPQSIFLAIPGKHHNGHSYISEMYAKGCRLFWVQEQQEYPAFEDAHYIISQQVLSAFQTFSGVHRKTFSYPVFGITGSNGKTIIKEWLFHVLSPNFSIVRSPKSYNSQIGVPLSLCLLQEHHSLAIIEAGISEIDEMQQLADCIAPTIGIFSNIGDAHQENFLSYEQKVAEKMKLFTQVQKLIYCADSTLIHAHAHKLESVDLYAWSTTGAGNIHVRLGVEEHAVTTIFISHANFSGMYTVPFTDSASVENCIHCIIAAHICNAVESLQTQLHTLPPVAMRLEQKKAKRNCTLINDSYNSDLQSIRIALEFLSQQNQHESKSVILSDVQQTGISEQELYEEIFDLLAAHTITRIIGIGPNISKYGKLVIPNTSFYETTQDFLQHIDLVGFSQETILLKGAREFRFEKIAQRLEQQIHQTVLEIHCNAIVDNLNYFRSFLQQETKIMVMVKAFSYGSGTYEIANVLQNQRVDYLAVAFVDEGVELRKAGIQTPIVVMNPEMQAIEIAYEHMLEIEVYNFVVLQEVLDLCAGHPNKKFGIHIKLDTGMLRYGFREHNVSKLLGILKQHSNCIVKSVFSHLAASDEARFDEFTREQISLFTRMSDDIQKQIPYRFMRHILNSAGIERFSEFQFDMVRLGIGLYGVSAINAEDVRAISTLKTHITSIKEVAAGESIGYSRAGIAQRNTRIAVLPIGYADGLRRGLSNGVGTVLLHGKEVPIIGNVCMDATMIDIRDIDAQVGDEVIIFGEKLPVHTMAQKLKTIPYEIITGISQRVKRIYYYE